MISDRSAGTAPPDDERLCASLRAGDQEALAELYDRHSSAAYSLAARMVGPAEAEDIVHDAFMVVVRIRWRSTPREARSVRGCCA